MQASIWPRHPQPKHDESFSSWFARLANANGVSARELYAAALPGARLFHLDLDRFADPDLVASLSEHTGVAAADLWARTLNRWVGRLYEEDDGCAKLIWLPPAGTLLSRRSFGQQLCPECLRDDEVPYLRFHWRLAFAPACPTHHRLLLDRGPQCSQPIKPLYAPAHRPPISCCWHCGFDFTSARPDVVASSAVGCQGALLSAAEEGWMPLGQSGAVHSLSAFRILWSVYRLLATGRFAYPLRRWLADRDHTEEPEAGIPRLKEIERLNPRHRAALIAMTAALLDKWPVRFVEACRDVGIASRVLVKERDKTPFALWKVATEHLSEPVRQMTREEAREAQRILATQGVVPTRRALVELVGVKSAALDAIAAPAGSRKPWRTDRYWKLDGVNPAVRAAAKNAAKLAGENVGPWVERVLREALARQQLL